MAQQQDDGSASQQSELSVLVKKNHFHCLLMHLKHAVILKVDRFATAHWQLRERQFLSSHQVWQHCRMEKHRAIACNPGSANELVLGSGHTFLLSLVHYLSHLAQYNRWGVLRIALIYSAQSCFVCQDFHPTESVLPFEQALTGHFFVESW